ncbi:GFA family protein [Sulfitobacter sp. JB4-11]|uniref:GFA family protein n=1 Tax=Sulfitobacter rhodophyticola TaxID=3238304 RepID=UPI003516668D
MGSDNAQEYRGACGCGQLTYRLSAAPLIVHCCHCRECQRQTGSAYVLNAIIEADQVHLQGETTEHTLSTPSGKGQVITRCAACGTAVCSSYLIRLGKLKYIRVGTLDQPELCPPDVQIFTASKQPWVPLREDIPQFEGLYVFEEVWSKAAYARLTALFPE